MILYSFFVVKTPNKISYIDISEVFRLSCRGGALALTDVVWRVVLRWLVFVIDLSLVSLALAAAAICAPRAGEL